MGFDAATAVEQMAYDFTKYGGGSGEIPEPEPERVARFWSGYSAMLERSRAEIRADMRERGFLSDDEDSPERKAEDNETDEEREERLERQVARSQDLAHRRKADRIALIADLCQDSPSAEQLDKLPDRLLRAFEAYLQGCLNPEAWSAATTQ